MKHIVVLGGGHGQSVILRGLKQIEDCELTAIVTVADDGGSTGRLRKQFHIPAMGDIRNVMCALAKEESLFSQLMDYRFEGEDDIGGHNLGNLILTALTEKEGNFLDAVTQISEILNVKGRIVPATSQVVTLMAVMEDDTIVRGESNIPNFDNRIQEVFYEEKVTADEDAIQAIQEADIIVIGLGSLYTSILPILIIPEIAQAIKQSHAVKYYFCNAMTQPGETDDYTLEDHVNALIKHTYPGIVDQVIFANDYIHSELVEKYQEKGSKRVMIEQHQHDYICMQRNLLDVDGEFIRHDPAKIRDLMIELMKQS